MKIFICALTYMLIASTSVYSQIKLDSAFNFQLSYRGISRDDITIPINLDKEKSPRNDSKLLIPLIGEMMKTPLKSFEFFDNINTLSGKNEREILTSLINMLGIQGLNFNKIKFPDSKSDYTGEYFISILKQINKSDNEFKKIFSVEEKIFLSEYLMSIISESDEFKGSRDDIFQFNKSRDSSIAVSKKVLDILSKADLNSIIENSFSAYNICSEIYSGLKNNKSKIKDNDYDFISNQYVQGNCIFYYDKEGLRIVIGGNGKNVYTGRFDFIIDTGGDDVYDMKYKDRGNIFENRFNCIIDLSGNDNYSSSSDYSLAGSVFSSGFIFDKEGDDVYKGKNVSLGSAICGIGLVCDESGNDFYSAYKFSSGAASFGAGLLYDNQGNDVYSAISYSQGFGMTSGAGAIADNNGNDSYLIDARSLDIGRYEDHYISMSQGFGLGQRPYYAGGIGLIIENGGNDIYNTDIYGQGGAYWYGLGCISDKKGNDKYNSYQYAQGSGIHLALGLLKDYEGWDFYSSNGVSQGCGHDFGFGFLHDVKGNDNYSAYSLSQGAGNANGIGIIIDESGRDGYLNKEPGNTRGYGNARRESGSLGIFLDVSGEDFYSVNGKDSVISNTSHWGVMSDYYFKDESFKPSGVDFKVPLDSNREFSEDELFIMAKTIEPRFSQWQEYGFRKLVQDSIKTADYILKYLDTEDHREALVLRNLAFKIGYSMGNVFAERLRHYLSSMNIKPVFNENQVSYICFLFGETGNPGGKEELLNLTHDENIKIKTSSVNALGKIKLDEQDSLFRMKASSRLCELALSDYPNKMLNKDISFALKNYSERSSISTIIELLGNNYFAVRFNAAECLKKYGDIYFDFLGNDIFTKALNNSLFYSAILNSIESLSEEKFISVIEKLISYESISESVKKYTLAETIRLKSEKSGQREFIDWAEIKLNDLLKNSELKIIY